MNCEKCKNRRATLFYADEGGRRHALCASCGVPLGKGTVGDSTDKGALYIPEPTLTLLSREPRLHSVTSADPHSVCRACGIRLEEVLNEGEVGCPECYDCFGALLFPSLPNKNSVYSARMPSARRKRLERERRLTELRVELRRAVDSESFELAATIRDKIRELEKQR